MGEHGRRCGVGAAVSGALLLATAGCGTGGTAPDVSSARIEAAAAAQAPAEADTGAVTVVGEGRATTAPDTATFVVGVEVVRPQVGVAFADAAVAAEAVIAALRGAGVTEEDIRTVDLSVRERRGAPSEPGGAEPPEVVGYAVTNLVEVVVHDVDRVGEVIAAAVEAGGASSRIQGFRLHVDDPAAALEQARRGAYVDAQERARQHAAAAGRSLGSLLAISEVVGAPPPGAAGDGARGGAEVAPPIEPGQQDVVVRLQVTWDLD